MTYQEVTQYLYSKLAFFQRDGSSAFKKDLEKTILLLDHVGNPQLDFKAVHIAGTNGKGSSAHSIASVLQSAGYKTGLYTSPHLIDFSERTRIDGIPIEQGFVIDFVLKHKGFIEDLKPSFFELTVAMAFTYFSESKVDIAVVETGMGGRLDSTNLVQPEVSLITNIGLDHQQFLGTTLPEIATEKAGIIKPGIPAVIGERQSDVSSVFESTALEVNSKLVFGSDALSVEKREVKRDEQLVDVYSEAKLKFESLKLDVLGTYYLKNMPGIIAVLDELNHKGFEITESSVRQGLSSVCSQTGLLGRWQRLQSHSTMFCDVGHNEDGMKEVLRQISQYTYSTLHFVYGTVKDKSIEPIVEMLPSDAKYYLCKPGLERGMDTNVLSEKFKKQQLTYTVYSSVKEAVSAAKKEAVKDDFIFVGGSTFVVAEIPGLGTATQK